MSDFTLLRWIDWTLCRYNHCQKKTLLLFLLYQTLFKLSFKSQNEHINALWAHVHLIYWIIFTRILKGWISLQQIPVLPLTAYPIDRIGGWGITPSVRNICSICFVLQWTVCQDLRAHCSKNETLTSLSHLIKEGTIIILLKLSSERKMKWKGDFCIQCTHMQL